MALYDSAFRQSKDDAALDFVDVVRQACATCGPNSELAQAVVLQASRAAWEAGDIEAALRGVRGLVHSVRRNSGDLVATVLLANQQHRFAAQWLAELEDDVGDQRPEIALWRARLLLDDCRFHSAAAAVARASLCAACAGPGTGMLARLLPRIDAAEARCHEALAQAGGATRRRGSSP